MALYKFTMSQLISIDEDSATELFFNEHLEEIRQRIFQSLFILSLIILIAFLQINPIVKVLSIPVANVKFFQSSPGEYFVSTLRVAFYTGLIFSTPLVLSQFLFFVLPGLNNREKKITLIILLSSVVLFLLGLLFSYTILIPAALQFFLNYSVTVIEPLLSFDEYFSFISVMFFSTGVVFQVPIIQVILSLAKIVDSNKMFSIWRYMIIISTIIGAVLTPSADPFTQLLLSSALFLLYLSGCFVSSVLT
ncbi:unnamed protein product [Chrysoparadoxa australica]